DYGNPTGGIILKSINGGISWTPTTHPSVPWMEFINFVTPDTGWVVGQNGLIMKTVDGGFPPPATPALISPVNNAVLNSVTPTLVWSSSANATNYSYMVLSGSTPVDSGTITSTSHIVPAGKLLYNSLYHWRVKASNSAGSSFWTADWYFNTGADGVNVVSKTIPDKYNLFQNYPNPFNPTTNIKFTIPSDGFVTLKVYDILGSEVSTLCNCELKAGAYNAGFDGSDLSSGVYFYKLISGDKIDVKKMMLAK
ncbi:MAG: T9SS type A sorting domain-containing protein, partial [Ignavibacteria bacterium]